MRKPPALLSWLEKGLKPVTAAPRAFVPSPVSASLGELTRKAFRYLFHLAALLEKLPVLSQANASESTEPEKLYQALHSAALKLEALYEKQSASDTEDNRSSRGASTSL